MLNIKSMVYNSHFFNINYWLQVPVTFYMSTRAAPTDYKK